MVDRRRMNVNVGDLITILVCTNEDGPYLDLDYIIRHKAYCTRKCDSWVQKRARCSEIDLRVIDVAEIEAGPK